MSGTNFGIYRPPASAKVNAPNNSITGGDETDVDFDEKLRATPVSKLIPNDDDVTTDDLKKEQVKLQDVALTLGEYTPTLPDSITNYYLHTAGLNNIDVRVTRLASVAALKHVADIVELIVTEAENKQTDEQKVTKVSMDLLKSALEHFGITPLHTLNNSGPI
ncbi:transcription initiation factor TFIID subunit 10b-like [Teleopsis dalmanni]|uniref:transcription initiation factor TFIID subunit 10b-like n=1 Tax=Teleopsis dalmanni TaxID=139649 RepID=UPI0018CD608B|nr:transcription initiation factor TFIID subunit 10b-like [Teleopsis dalmanni]